MVALLIRPRPVANCRQPKIKSTRQSNACNLAMVVFCLNAHVLTRSGPSLCADGQVYVHSAAAACVTFQASCHRVKPRTRRTTS